MLGQRVFGNGTMSRNGILKTGGPASQQVLDARTVWRWTLKMVSGMMLTAEDLQEGAAQVLAAS